MSTRLVIQKQAQAGIDIGNNGEQPRVSYTRYVPMRMAGFGGEGNRVGEKDVVEYPGGYLMQNVELLPFENALAL